MVHYCLRSLCLHFDFSLAEMEWQSSKEKLGKLVKRWAVTSHSLSTRQVLRVNLSEGEAGGEGKAVTIHKNTIHKIEWVQWIRHPPTCPVLYTLWVATSFSLPQTASVVTYPWRHFTVCTFTLLSPLHYKKLPVNLCKDFIIHWVLKLKGISLQVIKSRLLSALACYTLPFISGSNSILSLVYFCSCSSSWRTGVALAHLWIGEKPSHCLLVVRLSTVTCRPAHLIAIQFSGQHNRRKTFVCV